MVIYRKLLPRTKKRGVFYLSLEISLASYDEYPPALLSALFVGLISFSCLLFASHQLSVSPLLLNFSLSVVLCQNVTIGLLSNIESSCRAYLPYFSGRC